MKMKWHLFLCTTFLFLAACANPGEHGEGNVEREEIHGENEEHGQTITLTGKQARGIGLELGRITSRNMGEHFPVTGELDLFPQDRARVSPYTGGLVKTIHVIEGDRVEQGQILAQLEHPDLIRMQQDLQVKYHRLDYLRQEYERYERLYREAVGSGQEYQKARAGYLTTAAEVKGLKARLVMLGLDADKVEAGEIYGTVPVRAPIGGYIHEINIVRGEYADPRQPMFEITRNSRIHADLRVYEKDVYKVAKGQKVYFSVANQPDRMLEARIHSIEKAFEKNPKSVHVHALLEHTAENLMPGMYVEGRIVVSDRPGTVVPKPAVVSEGGRSFIYLLVDEDGHDASVSPGHDGTDNSEQVEERRDSGFLSGSAGIRQFRDEDSLTFRQVEVATGISDAGWVEIRFPGSFPRDASIAITEAYTLLSSMGGEREHHH